MFRRGDADTNGACEDAFEINAEYPGIGELIKAIGHFPIGIGLNRGLVQVGAITQLIDRVLVGFGFRQPIVDSIEQLDANAGRPGFLVS
jgi:hypothetical protein